MEENIKRNLSTNFHPLEIFSLLLFLLLLSQKERKATIPLVLVLVLVVVGVRAKRKKSERAIFSSFFPFVLDVFFSRVFFKTFSFSHPKLVKKKFWGEISPPLVGVIVIRLIFFIAFQRHRCLVLKDSSLPFSIADATPHKK